jgi:branched-chain amino acid transport system ATP-binding protein
MLEIRNVSTFYGHIQALKDVSLRAEPGEIVSLIGANGAGKSTLLNTISGLVPARQGTILLDGVEIQRQAPEAIVGLGISQVPERRQVFGDLTVYDNLLLGAYPRLRRREKVQVMADIDAMYHLFPILKERRKQLAGTLSGGEQQMLVIGRGLMARPKVLLLDEPSLGLAPLLIQEIFQTIQRLRAEKTTLLLVEQNARAALAIADRGYVLETGVIVMSAAAQDLIAHKDVQRAYLGGSNGRNRQPAGDSRQASAISRQPSAGSYQPAADSRQPSAGSLANQDNS